jgi:hypothetical protein
MGTNAGVGMSHDRNPRMAGREAAEKALKAAGIKRADFIFMFASVGYDQRTLLDAVRDATGRAPLCGGSGEGIIAGAEADESNFSVAVMAISPTSHDSVTLATNLKEDSRSGPNIARTLECGCDTLGLIVLADGLTFNFDRFLRASKAN